MTILGGLLAVVGATSLWMGVRGFVMDDLTLGVARGGPAPVPLRAFLVIVGLITEAVGFITMIKAFL